jgi:uncharacterized membrane protein (UPF0127 family)
VSAARSALAACVLVATACGAAPGSSGSTSPDPAPTETAVTGPRAVLPSGAVYRLELATVPEDLAQGLMYRENLPEKTGMLFVFAQQTPHHFWMKNTMIPLDIVWLDDAGKVIFVSADTPPCKADPCPTYGPDVPVRHVLELAAGMAKKEGVAVGTKIEILDVD